MSKPELNVDDILLSTNSFDDSDESDSPLTPLSSSQTPTPLHSNHSTFHKSHTMNSNLTMTHDTTSQIALSPSAMIDTLQALFSKESNNITQYSQFNPFTPLPATFLSFYNRHHRFFNLTAQSLPSPIEHRLQQHHSTSFQGGQKVINENKSSLNSPSTPLSNSQANQATLSSNLFSLTKFTNISQQLDEKKQFTGVPTAVTTNNRFICIGTSLGFVWLFDQFQTRFGCLGTATEHRQDSFTRGHVISMDTTPDGDFLIVAHRTGIIVIWDILEKKIHKIVDDFLMPSNISNFGSTTNVLQIIALPKVKADAKSDGTSTSSLHQNEKQAKVKETRHLIPFLFSNTNGGVAVVHLQRKFLVWTTDVKWVMNNPEKPVLQISLLAQPQYTQQPSNNAAANDFHSLTSFTRTQSMLGQGNDSINSIISSAPIVIEKHNLLSICFEERVMIVALEPAAKVLGVIPRDFSAPPSATAAGLKFHPIIRPFGPISSSWRSSRSPSSASTTIVDSNAIKNDQEVKDEPFSPSATSSSSIIAGKDYTQVYNDGKSDVLKSYYTGTRSFQHYTNFPLLALARGTLLQIFTAFDSQYFDSIESNDSISSAQNDSKPTPKGPSSGKKDEKAAPVPILPVAMEKVLIISFTSEIIGSTWINDTTLLIYTTQNPGIPADLAPPNPLNELTAFALDATTLRIFEHFTVPTSLPLVLQPYRSSVHQQSLIYDHSFHSSFASTSGSNGFATILGHQCVVSTVKMLNFIDRITNIAENDWILALSVAYEAWLKMKQHGSSLRATRSVPGSTSIKTDEIFSGISSLRDLRSISNLGFLAKTSSSNSFTSASFLNSSGNGNNFGMNFGLPTSSTSLGAALNNQSSLQQTLPSTNSALFNPNQRLHPRDLLFFQTSPVFRHLLQGYSSPSTQFPTTNQSGHKNRRTISSNDLVIFNRLSPSYSILDTNLYILLHSSTENSTNTPAVHSLCEKIIDLIVLQVDAQLRTYSSIISSPPEPIASPNANGTPLASLDDFMGGNGVTSQVQQTEQQKISILRTFNESSISSSSTSSKDGVSYTSNGNKNYDETNQMVNGTSLGTNQDEWHFAYALVTVTIHTVIDICLKLNRSDVLLKLIFPRIVKITNSLLSQISTNFSLNSSKDMNMNSTQNTADIPLFPHLITFRDTPSAHPTTIFLHRLFTVILTGHRNDVQLLDTKMSKYTTSQGHHTLLSTSSPSSLPSSPSSPSTTLTYSTISPQFFDSASLNQHRLLVLDDFFIDSTISTLITETKFALWLLRDNGALQKALHILQLPEPTLQLFPRLSPNSLVTVSLQIQRFLLQFKILLVNIHPIYLSLLANNINTYNETTKKKLLHQNTFPIVPTPLPQSSTSNDNLVSIDTISYPIYYHHTQLLEHLYSPINFATNIHALSSAQPEAYPSSQSAIASAVPQVGKTVSPQQPSQPPQPTSTPSQILTIASILQLVGQHLQNGLDISYIITLVKSFALLDEFLHLSQGLFQAPLLSHHLFSHFGYLHQLQHAQNDGNNTLSTIYPHKIKSYTTLHYLSWFLTQTSPHFSPYRPTLYDSTTNLVNNTFTPSASPKLQSQPQSQPQSQEQEQPQSHSLLTTLFFYYSNLIQGQSFFNNVNIQFVFPRLTLTHIRAAQQHHPKLFSIFSTQWDKQQVQLVSHQAIMQQTMSQIHSNMLEQSSSAMNNNTPSTTSSILYSPFATNLSGSPQLRDIAGTPSNTTDDLYSAHTGNNTSTLFDAHTGKLVLSTSPSNHTIPTTPSTSLSYLPQQFGMNNNNTPFPSSSSTISSGSQNGNNMIDQMIQFAEITATTLYRAQIISLLFSPSTLHSSPLHIINPRFFSLIRSITGHHSDSVSSFITQINKISPGLGNPPQNVENGLDAYLVRNFPHLHLFINELDLVSSNMSTSLSTIKKNVKNAEHNNNFSLFFALLCDLIAFPNWVVFSSTAALYPTGIYHTCNITDDLNNNNNINSSQQFFTPMSSSYNNNMGMVGTPQSYSTNNKPVNGMSASSYDSLNASGDGPSGQLAASIPKSFINSIVPSLTEANKPKLPHLQSASTAEEKRKAEEKKKIDEKKALDKKREEGGLFGWFGKVSDFVSTATTSNDTAVEDSKAQAESTDLMVTPPASGLGAQLKAREQSLQVVQPTTPSIDQIRNKKPFSTPTPTNLQSQYDHYSSMYTKLLPFPIPTFTQILFGLTHTIFTAPYHTSNYNPYLLAFMHILHTLKSLDNKSSQNKQPIYTPGTNFYPTLSQLKNPDFRTFFLKENIVSTYPLTNHVILLLSFTYYALVSNLINLSQIPPALLLSLVSFACLAPPSHILSIYLINLPKHLLHPRQLQEQSSQPDIFAEKLSYFSIPSPFPEITQNDLYLFHPSTFSSKVDESGKFGLNSSEIRKKKEIQNFLHTPRELLLLSLIPYVAGTSPFYDNQNVTNTDVTSNIVQPVAIQYDVLNETIIDPGEIGYFTDIDSENVKKISTLLFLAESSSFSRALLSIYIQQRNFERVLTSFLAITDPLLSPSTLSSNNATIPNNNAPQDMLSSFDLNQTNQAGAFFEEGGLIDDGQLYDSSSDDEDGSDLTPTKIPTTVTDTNVEKIVNPNKVLLRVLSKQLFAYISSELFTSLSEAIQCVIQDVESGLYPNESNKNTVKSNVGAKSFAANASNYVINPAHFEPFLQKLRNVLTHADELLQIYPLGIVTLYVLFSTALLPLPQLNFQQFFLSTLTQNDQTNPINTNNAQTNAKKNAKSTSSNNHNKAGESGKEVSILGSAEDTSTLYLFLKHLLYCYDLHSALNRGNGNNNNTTQNSADSASNSFQDDSLDSLLSDPISPRVRVQANNANSTSLFSIQLQSSVTLLSSNSFFTPTITPTRVAELMTIHTFTTPTQANQRYLELLCKFEPKRVYHYLFTKQSYSIDHALELCQKYQIFDAMAYILERTGDLRGSLDLLFKVITQEAEQIQPTVHHNIAYFLPQTMSILAEFYTPIMSHYSDDIGHDNDLDFLMNSNDPVSPQKKKLTTSEYLALHRKHQDEIAFRQIDFGIDNDVAHPSKEKRLHQYHDRLKGMLFYNPKVFSTLVASFPIKLRRLVWYSVQIAMNLCQRASEQGVNTNSTAYSNDLSKSISESTAVFSSTTANANNIKNNNKEQINTQLSEWEALWMDLLLLLIRTERSIAETRLAQFSSNLLPQITTLPTQQDIKLVKACIISSTSKSHVATSPSTQVPPKSAASSPLSTPKQLPLQPIDIVLLLLHASIIANIQRVLTGMLEYIPADKVLATAMKSYQTATFSSFQSFFNLLIESIVYELSLRDTTKRLLQQDHQNNTTHMLKRLAQPLNYTSPLQRLIKITSNRLCQTTNPTLYSSLQASKRKSMQQQLQFNIAPMSVQQFDTNPLLCLNSATLSCFHCTKPIDQTNGGIDSNAIIIFGCGHLFHGKCCGFDQSNPEHQQLFESPKLTTNTGSGLIVGLNQPTNSSTSLQSSQQSQPPLHCPTCVQRGLTQQQQQSQPKVSTEKPGATDLTSNKDNEGQNMQISMAGVFNRASTQHTSDNRFVLFQTLAKPVQSMDDDEILAQDPQQINKAQKPKFTSTQSPSHKKTSTNPFDDDDLP